MGSVLTALLGLLGAAASAVIGVRVRAWLIERRIAANSDLRVGYSYDIHTPEGARIMAGAKLLSLKGPRVVFVDATGRRLNLANAQFAPLLLVRLP